MINDLYILSLRTYKYGYNHKKVFKQTKKHNQYITYKINDLQIQWDTKSTTKIFWYLYLIKLTQIAKLSIFTKNIWRDTFV